MILNVFVTAAKIFTFWILLLILYFLIGIIIFGDGNNLAIYDLANWDGRHFLDIARSGYINKEQYAFFPLYPITINLLSRIINIDIFYSAILINLAASFGSIFFFLKLTAKYNKEAVRAVLFLSIFPTSFYLIAVYSESLFLLFSLLTFFFAEKKNFFAAAVFASFSLLTRITGIAVVLSLGVYLYNAKMKEKLLATTISFSGFILYCIYLYFQTGYPFYFLEAEQNWGRSLSIPGFNFLHSIFYIAFAGVKPESYTILSDLLFAVFGLGIGIRAIKTLNPSLAGYSIFSILIPLCTGLLLSIPRFLVVIFPLFITVSNFNNRIFKLGYVIISLVLLFLYFNFFLRNIWVS